MKKKLYSVITAVMILFACVFASACGDKYKNMEFKVLYAYSQDSKEWLDGSDGISLNYSQENFNGEGDDASLVFDENGVANLYVKIEVKNIKKKKYVDSITVSFASLSGLNFSSKRVNQDEVFAVPVTGNVDTVLKLYENNSGKKKELPFVVSRELEGIVADLSFKPAMQARTDASLSLLSLNNLTYLPKYQTNQVGVTYSISGIGKYGAGEDAPIFIEKYTAEQAQEYVYVENGLLKISDAGFFNQDAYLIRVKATSIYHDGSENEEDLIFVEFDVYVVDGGINAPTAYFADFNNDAGDDIAVENIINIYENGGVYSTSTISVGRGPVSESIYNNDGVYSFDGLVKYSIAIYVLNECGEYERYEFGSTKHQAGINGLIVEDKTTGGLQDDQFRFSIVNRTVIRNKIKVAYEIDGLDFNNTQYNKPEKEIYVDKGVLPTCVTVNDSLDLKNGDNQNGVIYGTKSSSYKGLELKLSANPNDDPSRLIKLVDENNGLNIVDEYGNAVSGEITTGSTVFVKFKDSITAEQTLKIKTLKIPTYYNGKTLIYEDGDINYIVASYNLTKVVTADAVEFVDSAYAPNKEFVIDANGENNAVLVKVYYSGVRLDGSTVIVKSDSDAFVFKNGAKEIALSDCGIVSSGSDANGKFDIYSVSIKKPNGSYLGNITVQAGGGVIGVEQTAKVSSVYLLDAENVSFNVNAKSAGVKKFDVNDISTETKDNFDEKVSYFAMGKGDFAEFSVTDQNNTAKTIAKIEIQTEDVSSDDFSVTMIKHLNVISNSSFDMTAAKIGGKTQVFKLTVYYYSLGDGAIELKSVEQQIQVAVYDGVGNITTKASQTKIGYLNAYYKEISETEISIDSYTSAHGTPANEVVFMGKTLEETIKAAHASRLKISINNYKILSSYKSDIDLKYISADGLTTIDLLKDQSTILANSETDFLNGKISLKLNANIGNISAISFSVSALRFGQESNVVSNVTIQVAQVDKADRIVVSGSTLVQTSDNTNKLSLSFIDVEDNGYDEESFNASLQFDDAESVNSLRFTNIETALTHILYKYDTDEFGKFKTNEDGTLKMAKVQSDMLNITYFDGKINVRARKIVGGGVFKLVLVAKDSYNSTQEPNDIGEENFNTKFAITISVEDGIGTAFSIKEEEELLYINNNLDKNFVLAANLDLRTLKDFSPLGWFNNTVHPFEGCFIGSSETPIGESDVITSSYAITMNVESSALSNDHGTLYGLFGILGENAIVKDLKLNAYYSQYLSGSEKGLKIGALAGVNNGRVSNLDLEIYENGDIVIESAAGTIDFGGIVGLNCNTIERSSVVCLDEITIKSGVNQPHNIGLIAGSNAGEVSGTYFGKESLNDFVFDVVSNLIVHSTVASGTNHEFNIGAVVGFNKGEVENLLAGGRITAKEDHTGIQKGNLGGLVGTSQSGNVETSVAMSCDLTANSQNVNIAGVVGAMNGTIIENVKFVSAITKFSGFTSAGLIKGNALVAGLVASATNGSISTSSVESFVDSVDNEIYGTVGETFYALQGGTTIAGLVANASGTIVDKSFVKANINSNGSVVLTSNVSETNTYFIGKVYGTVATDNTNGYTVVNDKVNGLDLVINDYLTEDKLDAAKWKAKWETLIASNGVWEIQEDYNIYNINGVDFFFPYLVEDDEAIMIVAPRSISASVNVDYVTEINSVHVIEYDFEKYEITESVIVNHINGAGDEANSHRLISSDEDGLFDVDILPEDAQGAYAYEIIGNGRNFAYINSKNQIVFTGVSGSTPILVRIYSRFNSEIEVYVAVYTQYLLSELKLNSGAIFYVGKEEYEVNAYSGQSNIILTMDAKNEFEGKTNYTTIFDVYDLKQYLSVEYVANDDDDKEIENSLLTVNAENYANITIAVKDEVSIPVDYSETLIFSLCLDKDYFGKYVDGDANKDYVLADKIKLADVQLKVHLYNSAKTIEVDGEDEEKTTHDDISFDVYLTTDYVEENIQTRVEELDIDENGNIVFTNNLDRDSIKIAFEILDGQEEVDALLVKNGLIHFAELFELSGAVVSQAYTPVNNDQKVIGYKYNVLLEIKETHNYRYISNNIKFNIIVYATSNETINSEKDPIEILLKPTVLSTARIENYKVTSLRVNTDYTDIVSNTDVQTSIVEPGSLGNVMMIYLEPTYSNVKSATIKTSELYVPSLGKSVKMKFTQLVHDFRKTEKGQFTTLYGADVSSQVDDTLELKLISQIDKDGNRIYNGVICVYIQLEEFSGLEDTMRIELNVETSNGKVVTRTRELLTTYLPGTKVIYDEEKFVDDGYLIQKGTSNNEVKIKIYGYQFNSNPTIQLAWDLPDITTFEYTDATRKGISDGTNTYLIGDYVSHYLVKDFDEVSYNPVDNSYTLTLVLNVSEDIMASFSVGAGLSLTTKDGQLVDSKPEENKIIFHPTEYILNSVTISGLANGRKNVGINKTSKLDFVFSTDNENNNLTEVIYQDLLDYAVQDGTFDVNVIASLFTYYSNGSTISFADAELHPEFKFDIVNDSVMSILGVEKFTNLVELKIWYGYAKDANGVYRLNFGQRATDSVTKSLSFNFTLNVYAINDDNEIPVYSADEIYNAATGSWNLVEGVKYVLMNDIELEQVVPITTEIAQFDGNNRVISIKSFAVNPQTSEFGLFGQIGTYTVQDQETEQDLTYPTLLKNVIVDYSKFEGTLAVNNNTTTSITFGGLVANNNGGLIYNCDVINLNASTVAQVDLIVANSADVVFGGLVGTNSGIITNSRVGRDEYTRIVATQTTESSTVKRLGGLNFEIYNSETISDTNNQFSIVAGGLVGVNTGTISTSYVSNTNLVNYSTNETRNNTAGFVGENSGIISYSYTKADDATITSSNPYSTGYVIENKGNGIVSGFVYSNSGTISNSYSNIELKTKSAYISGFVYSNSGTISESYAASSMNSGDTDSTAEQPFVGVDNAGNLLSNGTLENTYYLMRTNNDNPYKQGDKDVAEALNLENFQSSEHLIGFAFVLSNVKAEREQGIWSYYTTESKKRLLPELMNANVIAHSYRYVVDTEALQQVLTSAVSYTAGTANNPYIIKDVDDYNKVFTTYGQSPNNQVGYVRFINNIDFNNEETAIKTRTNYTLGYDPALSGNAVVVSSTKTSVDGNGMTISGIYLDVDNAIVDEIGLFAKVKNAYIKNLNLEFATPTTNGQFSTTTATYSGGLAGRIEDSVILNIKLHGSGTTLTGSNFVGGVAGLISGKSLIYGIETNLYVKASATESYLYYNEADYRALNIQSKTNLPYSATAPSRNAYVNKLSYAGGIAGVLDLTARQNVEYNVQFIDIRGDQMSNKTFEGKQEANISAEYAGGVAGYASKDTSSFRLKYFTGKSEIIRGDTAVGGLYGVCLGTITASQVTAEEDTQFEYDTAMGEYIIDIANNEKTTFNREETGNLALLEGYKYVGGLVGVGLNAKIKATYTKVGIVSGSEVGGLIGLSVSSIMNYSYSIPFINSYDGYKYVGGLIGSAYGIASRSPERNTNVAEFEALLKQKGVYNQNTDIQFTYSTLILDEANFTLPQNAKLDWISANYADNKSTYLQSNSNSNLTYVYSGVVNYAKSIVLNQTKDTSKSAVVELFRLYNVKDPDQVIAFQEVFSGWSIVKYWSLREEKYFPLLINETVDNFIEIDDQDDLHLIRNNPDGNFKVVKDIEIDELNANWIIEPTFSGVLLGELESDSRRPKITISRLKPKVENETSGFFKHTMNATISNLEFVWVSSDGQAIDLKNVGSLAMVSGLTCTDSGSLISNVEVRTDYQDTSASSNDGYLINSAKTIAGFGGIVGDSVNTNILGCNFIGKINATLYDSVNVNFGGIVGKTETKEGDTTEDIISGTAVINNSNVGASKATAEGTGGDPVNYPQTEFNLTIEPSNAAVNIGGIVGSSLNAAIASNGIGGSDYNEGYQYCNINVKFNSVSQNVYIGGTVGNAIDGLLANCDALANITITGNAQEKSEGLPPYIRVGGLAGQYEIAAASSLTSGISACMFKGDITTENAASEILKTSANTHVSISSGVAELSGTATMKQCLFTGSIDTEGSDISILYVGGAAARTGSSMVDIEEVTTYVDMIVGTVENTEILGTSKLYAGGIIGWSQSATISYVSSWGRIVPITNSSASAIYVGGLIGLVVDTASVAINNSYTISSIVADSIANEAIEELNIGALFGSIGEDAVVTTAQEQTGSSSVTATNVYYSSDYALFADENYYKDENGNDKAYGKNLSAQTMIYSNAWHKDLRTENETANNLWTSLLINGVDTRVPHLTSLTDMLTQLDVIDSVNEDFNFGSAMRPIQISTGSDSYNFEADKYQYYLLLASDGKVIPKFTSALNGILIGQDWDYDNTFTVGELSSFAGSTDAGGTTYHAIVPEVKKHSAISNLHVKLDEEVSIGSNSGIIAGFNNGVIFNSSVQGIGISVKDAGNLGLIASTNKGLVAYSYSTVEILDAAAQIGGIVHTNSGGKMLSNYFTGYINSSNSSAGMVFTVDGGNAGYIFNNYVGGVVTNINNTAFSGVGVETISGANNFLDSYSDMVYNETASLENKDILQPVSTSELMSGAALKGEWYETVDGQKFVEIETFGRNYNYPVYKFNKLYSTTGVYEDLKPNDWKNQLYTGTGENPDSAPSQEERYNKLINEPGSDDYNYYYHAYKIPHFGILTSVQALINKDRNYVVIYDLNGLNPNTNIASTWKSVGKTDGAVNGFVNTHVETNGEGAGVPTAGFHGVFISNKNFAQTIATEEEKEANICLISNLNQEGLFANVTNAYFADIKFGSFTNLQNSGVLGTNILAVTSDEKGVVINNISFDTKTVITGAEDEGNYYAGLFGSVDVDGANKGKLTIKKFRTTNEGAGAAANYRLQSVKATAGLLVGKLQGILELTAQEGETADTAYVAWFYGNKYAGGLVGDLNGGEIIGGANVINISKTNIDEESEYFTSILGGVAGRVSAESYIRNITVRLYDPAGDIVGIKTNTFGGIVGEVGAATTMTDDIKLDIKGIQINFMFNDDEVDGRYYGLLAGVQTNKAKIDVKSFNVASSNKLLMLNVVGIEGANYDEDTKTCGVGTFVGSQEGDLIVSSYEAAQVQLYANGVPNIGGVSGYYKGGAVSIPLNEKKEESFILIGTTNVGGLFGYCDTAKFENSLANGGTDGDNLLNAINPYSIVVVDGSSSETNPNNNYGGLFGRWSGEIVVEETPEIASEEAEISITNRNNVYIGYVNGTYVYDGEKFNVEAVTNKTGTAFNVGGIAGKMTASLNENIILNNNAPINVVESKVIEIKDNSVIKIANGTAQGENVFQVAKAQNVGGIFGLLQSTTDSNIYNMNNNNDIYGYQNVGGLIGYVGNGAKVNIVNDKAVVLKEDAREISLNADQTIEGATLNAENATKGNIYGVVNVGGAFGYAGANVSISQIYSQSNVYGNVNVGGLVGLAENASLNNNYIQGGVDGNGKPFGIVKGVYYSDLVYSKADEDITEQMFIPSSVGGFAGTATTTKAGVTPVPTMMNNILDDVEVLSSKESEGAVISTISNYMANFEIGNGNDLASKKLNKTDAILNLDTQTEKDKTVFNEIKTGFGGFFGTVDSSTISNNLKNGKNTNYLKNITVNAQLGVNIGTYFGAYKSDSIVNNGTENVVLIAPKLYGDIKVDGAYNVGGIVGFINGNAAGEQNFKLNNEQLEGNATITLQSEFTGMYVGGLIGKTNANKISDVTMSATSNINIKLDTSMSYYLGGIIGRAEVTAEATINLNNNRTNIILAGDDVTNFGGLIGMLKVGENSSGLKVEVSGYHENAFTINTVENSNYEDGDSTFNTNESNGITVLHAIAFYVNKDQLTIEGSSNEDLYDNDGNDHNPLNKYAQGWHKEYTAFRQIQRLIAQEENNGADWDSITVLYDAAKITHVGISSTDYDEYYKKGSISYTIYQHGMGSPILYSRIGIAAAMYDGSDSDTQYYKPEDGKAKWWEWGLGAFTEGSPPQYFFISTNKNEQLKDLYYFNWQEDKYNTISGNKTKFQNEAGGATLKYLVHFVPNYLKGDEDYQGDATCGKDDNGQDIYGAYFFFDVVYENGSMNGLSYQSSGGNGDISGKNDDYIPKNGSIFNVYGLFTEEAKNAQNNDKSKDWFGIGAKVVNVIVDAAIIYVTFGAGTAITAGRTAAKHAAKHAAKEFLKAAGKNMLRKIKTWGFKAFMKRAGAAALMIFLTNNAIAAQIHQQDDQNAYNYFAQPTPLNYGFLGNTYSKDNIRYEKIGDKVVLVESSDDIISNKMDSKYYYYSMTRPSDYYSESYLGMEITGVYDSASKKFNLEDFAIFDQENKKVDSIAEPFNPEDGEIIKDVTMMETDGSTQTITLGIKNGTYWLLEKKYEFINGQYYIHSYYGKIDSYRVTLDFKAEKYPEGIYNGDERTTPNYIEHEQNIYVHGTFKNEKYVYENNYPGNLLKYSSGKYSINGIGVTSSVTKFKELNYIADKSMSLQGAKNNGDALGYDYFDRAYYTANGNANIYVGEKQLVKYAIYKKSDTKPDGVQGLDYVERYYSYIKQYEDEEGNTIEVPQTDTYYYKLTETEFVETGIPNSVYMDKVYDTITVAVYPSSFVNPYSSTKYPQLSKSGSIHDYSWVADKDNGYTYYYTPEESDLTLSHNVEFYLYEGGYMVDEDVQEIIASGGRPIVYKYVADSSMEFYLTNEYTIPKDENEDVTYGDTITVTVKDLQTPGKWNEVKDMFETQNEQILSEIVKVIERDTNGDGKSDTCDVYLSDSQYTIGEDGLLHKITVERKTENEDGSAYENMYLSNLDFELYTRYKYTTDGHENNLTSVEGWNGNQLVPSNKTSTIINKGRPTRLAESVKVILGGGNNIRISETGGVFKTCNSGFIVVN